MDNRTIARHFQDHAHLLDQKGESLYRIRAYRHVAMILLEMNQPVAQLFDQDGSAGLERIPGIGKHLAYTITCLLRTGEFRTRTKSTAVCSALDRLTEKLTA